jgi:predicted Zn-dependent protease
MGGVYNPPIAVEVDMKTTWTMRFGAIVFASLLAVSVAIAAPPQSQQSGQQPTTQQTPDQTQQQTSPQQPPVQQPAPQNQQSESSSQPPSAQGPAPIAQPTDPNVKKGSEADVDAVGNRNVGHGLNFYSLEHEIALGKQLAQEVDRSAKFITDPVITEYVNRVGQNLVRNSDAQVPFTIKVIDSDQINAFALPGGFFYVNSGLIMHADEESELAGVMAHEIAHVTAPRMRQRVKLCSWRPSRWSCWGRVDGRDMRSTRARS